MCNTTPELHMAESCQHNCVNEIEFSEKGDLKTKDTKKKCYFYKKAKDFLKEKTEKQLHLSGNKDRS